MAWSQRLLGTSISKEEIDRVGIRALLEQLELIIRHLEIDSGTRQALLQEIYKTKEVYHSVGKEDSINNMIQNFLRRRQEAYWAEKLEESISRTMGGFNGDVVREVRHTLRAVRQEMQQRAVD